MSARCQYFLIIIAVFITQVLLCSGKRVLGIKHSGLEFSVIFKKLLIFVCAGSSAALRAIL